MDDLAPRVDRVESKDPPVDWAIVTDRDIVDPAPGFEKGLHLWVTAALKRGLIVTVREEPLAYRRIYEAWVPRTA